MSSKKKNGSAPEVPIFLQKTYHMIDTCPPTIATWSSDGLTFIVKNTHLFETTIIPQFFKHSKFSSFVRQLNFYGFRKIRFENSLKIDLVKEREQRNFWRFKHESFRRGRKDLLRDIKRSASSSSGGAGASGGGASNAAAAAVSPNASTSSPQANSPSPNNTTSTTTAAAAITPAPQEVSRLNTEVNTLKEQMQSMATKMDDLTSLVKGMSVSSSEVGGAAEVVSVGNKRKKVDTDSAMNVMMPSPEDVPSSTMTEAKMEEVDVDILLPSFTDDNNIHMSLEDAATTLLPDLTLSNPSSAGPSSLVPTPVLSRCSSLPDVSPDAAMGGEEDFVDELFHAFATDDTTATAAVPAPLVEENPNKPDPQLMKRIEDSLSTIPKTMHEMVANRLIDAIAEGSSSIPSSSSCSGVGATIVRSPSCESSVAASPNNKSVDKENTLNRSSSSSSIIPEGANTTAAGAEAEQTSIPLPLAIATLKTILADYGLKVECGSSSEDANLHRRLSNKSLPLVPIHA